MDWHRNLDDRIQKACGKMDFVYGKPLGPKPKFFIIGDSPVMKDMITGTPFSGSLIPILASAIHTIHESHGALDRECYITYLVKSVQRRSTITSKELKDVWLPIAQQEYAISGCDHIVAIGKLSRLFTGDIGLRPDHMPVPTNTWRDKIRDCYNIITR